MYIDLIIELICLSLSSEHYEETLIKNLTIQSPTENAQVIIVDDGKGNKYSIEVRKL
jgi:hypothetical protein